MKTSNARPLSSSLFVIFVVIVVLGSNGLFFLSHYALKSDITTSSIHQTTATLEQQQHQYSIKRVKKTTVGRRSSHPQNNTSLLQQQPKLLLPTPVIVLGYPKSGTTSVYRFFNCSGVFTQHFCCCGDTRDHPPCKVNTMAVCILNNMAQQRPMLQDCGDYTVFAQIDGERPIRRVRDMPNHQGVLLENGTLEMLSTKLPKDRQRMFRHFLPQHFYLERLHQEHPHATYILPLREASVWANSAFNWYQMRGRFVNEFMHYNASLERPGRKLAKAFLSRIYDEHSQMVRQFVRRHNSSHRLVEFSITDPDAGNLLAHAFGLDAACWGHHNKVGNRANEKKQQQLDQQQQNNK